MSRLKLLFVNPTNNTAGLAMVLGLSVVHADIYCMSDFSEENLLLSIDTVKVTFIYIKQISVGSFFDKGH